MKNHRCYAVVGCASAITLLLCGLSFPNAAESIRQLGLLVRIEQLSFYPDKLTLPGNAFAVLVVQNREDAPIQHEVSSKDLFQAETFVSVQGSGEIQLDNDNRVSHVLLSPGEEVVIWFYARKGQTYGFQCNINGHAMQGTIRAL